MKKIVCNNDLCVGMVLTVRNGNRYVVVADDNGHHDVINLENGKSNGIEVGTGKIAVCGGNNGNRDVVKIEEFDAIPTRNRLSEALKILVCRPTTEPRTIVWQAEDPRVTEAKERVARLEDELRCAKLALNYLL